MSSEATASEQVVSAAPRRSWRPIVGVFVCLLVAGGVIGLAAFNAWHESRKDESRARLIQIYQALQKYEAEHEGKLPQAITVSELGTPMHSWRTRLLPYVNEEKLLAQYSADEFWNGPHNEPLVAQRPAVFASPGDWRARSTTHTSIVAVIDEDSLWPSGELRALKDASDGADKTLCLIEIAGSGIDWTEPNDVPLAQLQRGINQPHGVKSVYQGGILGLFADGSVRFISERANPKELKALVTRSRGDQVDLEALTK